MALLTIFTAPKPFTNPHIDIIQRNAIQSWLHLGSEVQVLLIGDEPGMSQVASEYGVQQLTNVRRNEKGTPLVNSMFDLARQASQNPFLVCVNADIIFLPDLISAVHQVAELCAPPKQYLMISQRWDLDQPQLLNFSNGWDQRLRAQVKANGKMHAPAGSDFFVFPREIFLDIPDFAIGRAGWDNWMIYQAKQSGWLVVDATPSVMVIHQSHDYGHLPGGRPHYELPESTQNQVLAGDVNHMYMILDSDKQLRDSKLRNPPMGLVRALRQAEVRLRGPDSQRKGLRWSLARQMRRFRRRITGSL
jgi:hypothetical protein